MAPVSASNSLLQGHLWRLEVERASRDAVSRRLHLREDVGYVDAAVGRGVRPQSARRLLELTCRRDGTAAARLVPRDRDVDEPLEEIPLLGRRRAPRQFELLVRLEVVLGANRLEPALECSLHCVLTFPHGDDPAVWGRTLHAREARGSLAC